MLFLSTVYSLLSTAFSIAKNPLIVKAKRQKNGNDTIDPYPLQYGEKLTKILCIDKKLFEKLKTTLDEFGFRRKPASPKPIVSSWQKVSKKEPLGGSRSNDFKPDKYKPIRSFEPSNIYNTYNSFYWRLRNLKAWFKEQESYEDLKYRNPYLTNIMKAGTY